MERDYYSSWIMYSWIDIFILVVRVHDDMVFTVLKNRFIRWWSIADTKSFGLATLSNCENTTSQLLFIALCSLSVTVLGGSLFELSYIVTNLVYTGNYVPLHSVSCCHLVSVAMGKPLLFAQEKERSVFVAFSVTK